MEWGWEWVGGSDAVSEKEEVMEWEGGREGGSDGGRE